MLYKLEYATDTYQVFNFSKDEVYNQFAMSGRFITACIGKFIKIINLSEQAIYTGSYVIAIVCLLLSQYKLYNIIKDDIKGKNRLLGFVISFLIIINPFSIELFLYIEKGIMWFGVLMSICTVQQIKKYFEVKRKRNIVLGVTSMFAAYCSYQGVVGIFIAVILIYVLKYSKSIKQFILNNIISGGVYGVAGIINYILIRKTYPNGRIGGNIKIIESLGHIGRGTAKMITTSYGLLPNYMFILAIVFTFIILCCKIKKIKELLPYVYIVIGVTVVTIIPQLIQSTSAIWFVPRTTYSFGALYGILLCYISSNYEINKVDFYRVIVISVILIVFQMIKFEIIINDRYELNNKDYEVSIKITEKIKKYEEETNSKITKIQIYTDGDPKYTYEGIFSTGDINIKAYSTDWSTEGIIEYYLKRKLEKEKQSERMKSHFLNSNWNDFYDEQIILKGDTLILCRF